MGELGDEFRDFKEHKKQQKKKQLGNPQPRRCYDWMLVSGAYHYARNRSSFKTYRPINATAQGAPVIGVGTVELQVKRSPSNNTNTLVLEDVLHIPGSISNGFCWAKLARRGVQWGEVVQATDPDTGRVLWHGTEFCGLMRLVLAGNPKGESPLADLKAQRDREGTRMALALSLYISEEEEAVLRQQI